MTPQPPAAPRACPVCGTHRSRPVLEIGSVPIFCNRLWPTRAEAQAAPRGDLVMVYCPVCGHLFNAAFDPRQVEYTPDYENSLHFSPRFQRYAAELAQRWVDTYDLHHKHLIEIGAGQGDFLSLLCRLGENRGLGFDPSYAGPAAGAPDANLQIIRDLYSAKYADRPADFIFSRQVLEHLPAANAFVAQLRALAADRPQLIVAAEVPNALYTLEALGIWDLIYEHPSYFSPASLQTVFERNGFTLCALEPVFGGQFLTIEVKPTAGLPAPAAPLGLATVEAAVAAFAGHYARKVAEWGARLAAMAGAGQKAVVWGAGSKGVSFLNTLANGSDIEYVVDVNPRKHGHFVAGTGQAIVAPDFLSVYRPEVIIVMNGNYIDEIKTTLQGLGLASTVLQA